MATEDKTLLAFNRGVISSRGLARVDLDRMAMSAEIQSNFIPRVLGSMMLRQGMEYIDNTDDVFTAGLGFAVDLTKPGGFIGSEATAARKAIGPPTQRLVQILVKDPQPMMYPA